MVIIHSIQALRDALQVYPKIAFVPTMGNLHAGHISLVELAKQRADCVVVSIFVNPLQFGPNEDLANYPRTFEEDKNKLAQSGVKFLFAPTVTEMYPDFNGVDLNQQMTVQPPPIANELCGAIRPGHFMGVATVVTKLFNIVQPDIAVFGKKDFQQLMVIRELVRQLNMAIEIVAGETTREPNGLAMSSRNGYLSFAEKTQAMQLNRTLSGLKQAILDGETNFEALEKQATIELTQLAWKVDYIAIRSAATLRPAKLGDTHLVVLGAAKLGKTRLIDNIEVHL